VHNCFKKNFKFLVTDTVEHSDGVQKCIRVRLGSGTGGGRGGGGRGRKRKNMGGSGWRDDSPFDSRGSSNWLDHVGKFLRLASCLVLSLHSVNLMLFLLEGVLARACILNMLYLIICSYLETHSKYLYKCSFMVTQKNVLSNYAGN
jgi:hypothetical protein